MRLETFEKVIHAMTPSTNRIDAEAVLLGAFREHRVCPQGACDCALLDAAGSFYMAMAYHAQGFALEKLMEAWIEVARTYDKAEDLDGPAHKMYATAVTYRLLLS